MCIVLTQPYVNCLQLATKEEIDDMVAAKGFRDNWNGKGVNYISDRLALEDMHPANVFIDVVTELEDILLAISWADLSKTYFGKSNSWLYHKLDGFDSSERPVEFTEDEKVTLKGALVDLADRIRRATDNIE